MRIFRVVGVGVMMPVGGRPPEGAALDAKKPEQGHRELHGTTEIIAGTAAKAIAEYARDRGMDLIVMGTHGRSGVAHVLMGSVAERVVRTAPCPVLTVRA